MFTSLSLRLSILLKRSPDSLSHYIGYVLYSEVVRNRVRRQKMGENTRILVGSSERQCS